MLTLPELLAELVRLPSVNPMGRTDLPTDILYESRVIDRWEAELRTLGVEVTRQAVAPGRENLVAVFEPHRDKPGGSSTILLEAHTDTVPVDGMTIDPFGGVIDGGKLWGRGACDVKGGGVAMYGAFRRMVLEKPANAPRVILAFTVDEEHTFFGAQTLVKSGLRADFAIVAEPTSLNIVRSHKGVVRWQMETSGRACHSSRPQDGVNAVYKMAGILTAIEAYSKELQVRAPHPQLGDRTLAVGTIHGGVSPNTIPDRCLIDIDRRLLPGESPAEAIADLDRFLHGHDYTVHPKQVCPALMPTGGDAYVAKLGDAIDRIRGSHEIWHVPYGTDASTIQEAGIPAVVFGPGDIQQAHTKDEWIDLGELESASEILFEFLNSIY